MKIAIFGKIRSGKSAVCDYICDKYDCTYIEVSGAVQEVVDVLYPKLKGTKNREKLIGVGQHMRKYDEDVWANVVKYKVQNSDKPHILVSGVRQQNEFDTLKRLGFTFIKVDASEVIRIERCTKAGDSFDTKSLRDHTELVSDEWEADYVIKNEKGFKEFELSIRSVLAEIIEADGREAFFKDGMSQFIKRMECESSADN